MQFGGSRFVTDEGIGPAELGAALEPRRFESHVPHKAHPIFRQHAGPTRAVAQFEYYRAWILLWRWRPRQLPPVLVLGTGIALIPNAIHDRRSQGGRLAGSIVAGTVSLRRGWQGWLREEVAQPWCSPAVRGRVIDERCARCRDPDAGAKRIPWDIWRDCDPIYCWRSQ